ncbi:MULTISPECIES: ATP-dependent zinc protease family protein [Vibrio]|uniref:ATP-dependent Zn protease n=1 Tax=Vibrio aestuarianus TaxID=28171 RepID=A0A7X6N8Q4_9VIBR|nr:MULTISPECIES: ATP-dependent zinc protease [Vibrio]KOE82256.1 ATP-dependent Zn protease [Vibrio alginolyticus]MDE1211633.1 ATP-dependent zinc protease [Vibrio aestuarianus]MDE1214506.1 ATP-dependent zinc protease [Vibrio aestuarianus]MDE1219276.1 ATP-dependent zinc protease [Vibrio aestuarianus]MDE1222423.1 ATP-dependent zinc protease [Vibrio aestuarianus]
MKQQWKVIVPLMLSGSLMACSTTSQIPVEPEQKPKVEQPKPETEQQTKPAEKPVEKPAIVLKAKKTSDGKLILGEKEWVYVPGLNENFRARVDTGATTSSISAVDVVNFERDGKDWVKFRIEHDNVKSDEISLPVERWVNIRQSSAEGTQQRAVVVAWIEIGDLKERTEFTLADRTHLTFPLLLGRSFFKDVAVVDVSRKYVQDKHK